MAGYADPGFDTLALQAGATPDATGARAVPIHLTTSFVFESSDHAASLFNLERAGHVYSRISNPTNAVLEQRISALEERILGERLERVRIASAFLLRTAHPAVSDTEGKTVRELRRIGKRIAIGVDNDLFALLAPSEPLVGLPGVGNQNRFVSFASGFASPY